MTCIVGIEKNGVVWLGGDAAATSPDMGQTIIGEPKVFANGSLLIGVCGSPKVMDALKHTDWEPYLSSSDSSDGRTVLVNEFAPAFTRKLKELGCLSKFKEDDSDGFYGALLLGYKGKLYNMQSNFQLITTAYGFNSVGSGSDIALGSLHATGRMKNPKQRILKALEAAAINNAAVRPPFTIISSKKGFWK